MVKLKVSDRLSLSINNHQSLGDLVNLHIIEDLIRGGKVHSIVEYDEETSTSTFRLTPETARKLAKGLEQVANEIDKIKNKNLSQAY